MEYDDSGRPDRKYGNTGPGAVLSTISFAGVAIGFLLIANRLYWRWKKGIPGVDDAIIVLAWVSLVSTKPLSMSKLTIASQIALFALSVITYVAIDYGYGRSSSTLTRNEASRTNQVSKIIA